MNASLVTVVIVPRDRFSVAAKSLESVLAHTPREVSIVYMDAGSPKHVRDYLRRRARERNIRLVRFDECLPPNVLRNLALPLVHTPNVVFIDNDNLVAPLWLEHLVECAQQTEAWLVGPLYCELTHKRHVVHMAGGIARIHETPTGRHFEERHFLLGVPVDDARHFLERRPTEMIEFHCVLARVDALQKLGSFDEQILSSREHIDLCLTVREAGGGIYLEPRSEVTNMRPPPLAYSDLSFFWLRWSDAWNVASLNRFRDKWNLAADDPSYGQHLLWLDHHRRNVLQSWRFVLKLLGRANTQKFERCTVAELERVANRWAFPSARVLGPWPQRREDAAPGEIAGQWRASAA